MVTRGFNQRWLMVIGFAILLFSSGPAAALDIMVTGDYLHQITADDLLGGPGTDLKSTYESGESSTVLNITAAVDNSDAWHVDVRRVDTKWPSPVSLSIRRTGDGIGLGAISGGGSYIAIDSVDRSFISGTGNRSGITAQIQFSGMSISVPPDTYETTLYFTVVDDL